MDCLVFERGERERERDFLLISTVYSFLLQRSSIASKILRIGHGGTLVVHAP